jgi:PAS domain S-box-containing protein
MKIRTWINILAAISCAMLLLVGVALYLAKEEVSRADADVTAIRAVVTDISRLRYILVETIVDRDKHVQATWNSRLESMRGVLTRHVFSTSAENQVAHKIIETQALLDSQYAQLLEAPRSLPDPNRIGVAGQNPTAKTASALLGTTQAMLDDAAELARLIRESMQVAQRNVQIIVLLGGAIMAINTILLWFFVRRRILQPLVGFQRGTEMIAQGKLAHRLNMTGNDEIGVLACTFDAMTAQLQDSLETLKAEIEERERSQKLLSQYSEDLASDLHARRLAEQELRIAQDQLKGSEMRYRLIAAELEILISNAAIGILFTSDGVVVRANQEVAKLFGYIDADAMIGINTSSLYPSPDDYAAFGDVVMPNLVTNQPVDIEWTLCRRSGEFFPARIAGRALPEESYSHGAVWVLEDVTERRRIERLKSDFISVVSHELRTPLTSIRGALGLLDGGAGGGLPDGARKLISIAHKNSVRLAGLVNDILDMEKLMAGNMHLDMQEIDLVALVAQSIEANETYAMALKVRYVFVAHPEAAFVLADRDRLMQVLANLLSNAAKFSPEGGQVDIRILHHDNLLRVELEDRGEGIPLAFRDRVFEAFAQADSTDARRRGGTGLGLHISKNIIENLGGQLGFDSKEGCGTTFWFTFPEIRPPDSRPY